MSATQFWERDFFRSKSETPKTKHKLRISNFCFMLFNLFFNRLSVYTYSSRAACFGFLPRRPRPASVYYGEGASGRPAAQRSFIRTSFRGKPESSRMWPLPPFLPSFVRSIQPSLPSSVPPLSIPPTATAAASAQKPHFTVVSPSFVCRRESE